MGTKIEEFQSDSIIFSENSENQKMYIVLEGQVILYRGYGTDDEYVLGACSKGATFGELNIFTSDPSLYTAVAFTDVKLAGFQKSTLDSFIKNYPDSTIRLLENISKSYALLGKNLQMAIEEINFLSKNQSSESDTSYKIPNESGDSEKYDILEELQKIAKMSGSFHYFDADYIANKRETNKNK